MSDEAKRLRSRLQNAKRRAKHSKTGGVMDWKRLEEIEARAEKATPGPWLANNYSGGLQFGSPFEVCLAGSDDEFGEPIKVPKSPENAVFMATARSDIPWLCEQLREARRLLEVYADDPGPKAISFLGHNNEHPTP